MILTRNSTRLDIYAEALEEQEVPYDLTGGGTLGDSRELQALLEVLKAVYDPDNPVPLIAYLRGPFVGLSDDELYEYSASGGELRYESDVPSELEDETVRRFQAAFGALRRMEDWLDELSVSAAVERFLDDRGILGFSAVQKNGSSRAGTLLKVVALIEEIESQAVSWTEVMHELQEVIDDDSYKIEEMTLEAGARNENDEPTAVQVMNLHKAKGLEASVVFLADPYSSRGGNFEPYFHVSRVGEDDPFVVLPVTRQNRYNSGRTILYRPKGWGAFAAEEERFLEAENMRLLYVAATRAENLLVVSRYQNKDDKILDGYWGPLNSYLTDVAELEECEVDTRPSPDISIDPDLVAQRRDEIRETIGRPSFELDTVTDESGPGFALQGAGCGREYGNLVHTLFEMIISGHLAADEVPEYMEHASAEYDVNERQQRGAEQAVERLLRSDLWDEIQTAKAAGHSVYTEIPFADRKGDIVTTGQIDLVIETIDGWKIVDFKTESAESPSVIGLKYAAQLAAYQEHWEKISGASVASTRLWLTEEGRSIDVE
jgi:ATP-dependent helicase/nuclease subunit A